MADVTTEVANIRAAVLGIDVRDSIANGIEDINTEVVSTTAKEAVLEGQFNSLVINAGSSNAEIVAGRTSSVTAETFDTIGHRADGVDAQLVDNTADLTDLGYNIRWNSLMVVGNDWTVAIQTAIDNNEIVLIPAGTFNHTTLYLKDNTRLIGQGDVSILQNDTNSSSIVIGSFEVMTTTLVSNLYLKGNNIGLCFNQDAIEFVGLNPAYVILEKIRMINFGRHGIHGGHTGHVNNVEIKQCFISGCIGDGINIQYDAGQVNAIWIHHNNIVYNNNGILFYGNNVIVEKNTIQANRNYGVSLSDSVLSTNKLCYSSAIINNYFELNASAVLSEASVIGIFSGYSATTPTTNKVIRGLIIANNYSGESNTLKYRSFIYAEDLKSSLPSNSNCAISTKNNYITLPLLSWNKDSALSDGCVLDETRAIAMPSSMLDILPARVEVRGIAKTILNTCRWTKSIELLNSPHKAKTFRVSVYSTHVGTYSPDVIGKGVLNVKVSGMYEFGIGNAFATDCTYYGGADFNAPLTNMVKAGSEGLTPVVSLISRIPFTNGDCFQFTVTPSQAGKYICYLDLSTIEAELRYMTVVVTEETI